MRDDGQTHGYTSAGGSETDAIYDSHLESVPLLCRGKVRDLYDLDDRHLLMIASDRLSAFDVVFPTPIPDKGRVLSSLSQFWFAKTAAIIPNHTTNIAVSQRVPELQQYPQLAARSMIVKKTKPLAVEAVVRGYLYGSAFRNYRKGGKLCDIALPSGLRLADRLPEAIFTPTTKAAVGAHDMPIAFGQVADTLGAEIAAQVRDTALALYEFCSDYARSRGIIVADTKFEFGLDAEENLVLIDEILTPDSSRFWDSASYEPGKEPVSFDKQYVRNYLIQLGWDSETPPPELPPHIIDKTTEKYRQIESLLMEES